MQLQARYAEFQDAGIEIVAISSEDRAEASTLKNELAISFPILSDADRAVIERYGVFHENEPKGRPIARPSVFIIDPEGIIRYRYVGEDARDRPSPDELLRLVLA